MSYIEDLSLLAIGVLLIILSIALLVVPVIYTHVLVVNNNVEQFKYWFTIAYWLTRIIGIIEGIILVVTSLVINVRQLILGAIAIWLFWLVYPHYYDIVISMVDNTLSEPLSLAVVKLLLINAISGMLALELYELRLDIIEKKLEE